MTIKQINEKRMHGDIATVSKMSGIPRRTIEDILREKRSEDTKRGRAVIAWFSNFLECRGQVTGESKEENNQ
jgi:hypothetical protein